jgi:hypothetical protein
MRVDFFGLIVETSCVSFYLWSPWRASRLEHRLFEAIRALPTSKFEESPDELRLHIYEPRTWRNAMQVLARTLKGWQEEAEQGSERRHWRWLLEGDTDADGFDHHGEPLSLWGFLRVSIDRSAPGENEKSEDYDMDFFGLRIWGSRSGD